MPMSKQYIVTQEWLNKVLSRLDNIDVLMSINVLPEYNPVIENKFKSMQDMSPLWLPVPLNLLPDTQGMSTEEKVELMSSMVDKFDVVPRDLTSTR